MGCFLCGGSAGAPVKESPAALDAKNPAISGSASCRRVSLDPYAAARAPADGAAAAKHPNAPRGSPNAVSVSAAPAGGRAVSSPDQPAKKKPTGGSDYIEVNPLRRMSLPTAGQEARPVNNLRRGSMPTAILTLPHQQAAASAAAARA